MCNFNCFLLSSFFVRHLYVMCATVRHVRHVRQSGAQTNYPKWIFLILTSVKTENMRPFLIKKKIFPSGDPVENVFHRFRNFLVFLDEKFSFWRPSILRTRLFLIKKYIFENFKRFRGPCSILLESLRSWNLKWN